MPKKTKEQKDIEIDEITSATSTKKTDKNTLNTTTKLEKKSKVESKPKTTIKTKTVDAAKISTKKAEPVEKQKKATKKAVTKTKNATKSKSTVKKSTTSNSSKKTTKSKTTTVKSTSKTKSKTSSKTKSKAKPASTSKFSLVEYYDLPYRYNQTVVKVLAQTPNTLFIYWDIADEDRENFKKQYGYNFFEKTRPVLIIHNKTMNYSFEVEINDFANSWYLHVNDANCDYRIELGRKPNYEYIEPSISQEKLKDEKLEYNKYPSKPLDKNYFYISMSNRIDAPNDRILLEKKLNPVSKILIRNVKSNVEYEKPIANMPIAKQLNHFYNINIYEIYKLLFEEETYKCFNDLSNPSSGGNPSSGWNKKF